VIPQSHVGPWPTMLRDAFTFFDANNDRPTALFNELIGT
jgi:hypothetical protein